MNLYSCVYFVVVKRHCTSQFPLSLISHIFKFKNNISASVPPNQLRGFITDRLGEAEDDPQAPPYDTLREFAYEGSGSDAGSLSSIETASSDRSHDYDYLHDWGPKFARLADMYNTYDDSDADSHIA